MVVWENGPLVFLRLLQSEECCREAATGGAITSRALPNFAAHSQEWLCHENEVCDA